MSWRLIESLQRLGGLHVGYSGVWQATGDQQVVIVELDRYCRCLLKGWAQLQAYRRWKRHAGYERQAVGSRVGEW